MIRNLLLSLCVCCALASCSSGGEQRRVLVVHSYEANYTGYPEFNRLIEKQFDEEGIHADIRTVYLDCETYDAATELVQMGKLLDSVSRGWTPEIILVNEDQATYSLLASEHPLSKNVPVVFGGVNYPNHSLLAHHSNVTGFHDRMDILENIFVSQELFGKGTGLFTILDFTYLDKQIRSEVQQQIEGQKVIGFMDTEGVGVQSLWQKVREEGYIRFFAVGARVQQGDAGLMWTLRKFYAKQCYLQLKRDFTTINIGNISYNPSLTAINEAFGFGEKLLGGYFTTLPIQVEEEVGVAARILRGAKTSDIPISDSRKEYTIDWNVMSQLNIPLSSIPDKYHIINISLRDKHPVVWSILATLLTLTVTALIVWLFLLYRREHKRRRNALHALADEKQTLSLAIEGSNTYAWRFENGLFAFERLFWEAQGIPPRKYTIEEILTVIHPDNQASVSKNWNPELIRKRIAQMRCDFNGGGYLWWEFRYTTIQLENGEYKTAGLLLNIQDVKDREQELEESRKLAEKAELKESFLANMSHEIRTPLNAIVGFSNILASEEEIEADEKQLYVETINHNNELLLKLVNDILELSRIESGSMSFELSDCLVSELVDSIYVTHRMLIPGHLEFIREADPLPLLIHVDTIRLTQAVSNFLNNAGKFTQNGSIKLGYRYLPDAKQVCIYVEDTGQGIPPEEQKAIFNRFYKRDEFAQGTGLGLSICQVIVEKLGGSISLWSEPGKGSRFMVTFPCKVVGETS